MMKPKGKRVGSTLPKRDANVIFNRRRFSDIDLHRPRS